MRSDSHLVSLAAAVLAGFVLAASVFLLTDPVLADGAQRQAAPHTGAMPSAPPAEAMPPQSQPPGTCSCPGSTPDKPWKKQHYAELSAYFDESDELAVLEALQVALAEVGDGATYVWHRQNGRLNGLVQPTRSFKDAAGRICRHLVVMLVSGEVSKRTDTVACRLASGRWQVEG
jgi:hypothetical protein